MMPKGLALQHPAVEVLREWATYGCPSMQTGKKWMIAEMEKAIWHGLHESTLEPAAVAHSVQKVAEKVQ